MKRLVVVAGFAVIFGWSLGASATVVDGFVRSSEVTTVVGFVDPLYRYEYTVHNTSIPGWLDETNRVWVTPTIVDFEIPLGGVDYAFFIESPAHWSYEYLSAADYEARFGVANPYASPYVLHWYTDVIQAFEPGRGLRPQPVSSPIFPGESLSGFVLQSYLSPIDGPYLTSWLDEARNIGDPPLPGGSPVGGGTVPFIPNIVPEPATISMLGLGLTFMAVLRLRKRV